MTGSYALYRCAVLSTSSGSLSGILDRDSPIQILHLGVEMEGRVARAFGQRCFYNTAVV